MKPCPHSQQDRENTANERCPLCEEERVDRKRADEAKQHLSDLMALNAARTHWHEAEDRCAAAVKERDELVAWKASMISVMPPMQKIAELLNIPWGTSIHDKIVPGIEALKKQLEQAHLKIRELIDDKKGRA